MHLDNGVKDQAKQTRHENDDWDVQLHETFKYMNTIMKYISSKRELFFTGQIPVIQKFEEIIRTWNMNKKFIFFIYYYDTLVQNPIFYQIIGSKIFENVILIQSLNKTPNKIPFSSNCYSRHLTSSNKFLDEKFFNLKYNFCGVLENKNDERYFNREFVVATRENLEYYRDTHSFIKKLRFLKFDKKFVNPSNFEFISKCRNLHSYETNYPNKIPQSNNVRNLSISLKRNSNIPVIPKTFSKSLQKISVYVEPRKYDESKEDFERYMSEVSEKIHCKNLKDNISGIKSFVVQS